MQRLGHARRHSAVPRTSALASGLATQRSASTDSSNSHIALATEADHLIRPKFTGMARLEHQGPTGRHPSVTAGAARCTSGAPIERVLLVHRVSRRPLLTTSRLQSLCFVPRQNRMAGLHVLQRFQLGSKAAALACPIVPLVGGRGRGFIFRTWSLGQTAATAARRPRLILLPHALLPSCVSTRSPRAGPLYWFARSAAGEASIPLRIALPGWRIPVHSVFRPIPPPRWTPCRRHFTRPRWTSHPIIPWCAILAKVPSSTARVLLAGCEGAAS